MKRSRLTHTDGRQRSLPLVLSAATMLASGLAGTETSAQAVAPPPVVTAPAPKPAPHGYPEKMRLLGCGEAAREVYALLGVADWLVATYPPGPHGFPPEAREEAYRFLDRALGR